ncbi:hypothetical protein [Beihai anemone virus 1]|uniref:hypothetical protein n=1 Tax=Beihai anemone virus 1 TaxID=1922352 RepID=UPI00090CC3EB|nr:hypothetical protein [Beihai anemone virus 1]APG77546.1 hypothetical protein [Beihai anemone virus 1]
MSKFISDEEFFKKEFAARQDAVSILNLRFQHTNKKVDYDTNQNSMSGSFYCSAVTLNTEGKKIKVEGVGNTKKQAKENAATLIIDSLRCAFTLDTVPRREHLDLDISTLSLSDLSFSLFQKQKFPVTIIPQGHFVVVRINNKDTLCTDQSELKKLLQKNVSTLYST